MPVDLQRAHRVARRVAAEAGALLERGMEQEIHVENKGSIDLVTEWDRRSEAIIVEALTGAFPDHRVVAEEGAGSEAGASGAPCWYVDPLDGTTNYAHRLPFYAVSIALEVEGKLEVAVVHAPHLGWEFHARRGEGTWLGDRRVSVSRTDGLVGGVVATGFPYDRRTARDNNLHRVARVVPQVQGFRRLGSAALDCALVAWGRLDAYWEVKIKPWDIAAGVLLVQEAGGIVTALDGGPFELGRPQILASNGAVHEEMVTLLADTSPP